MDGLSIDASQLNHLALELAGAGVAAGTRASQVVRASAQRVVSEAQRFVPVDTSATKNSIHASAPGGGPIGTDAEIGPTTYYAPYLEYGTVRMAPYAFMGPALDRVTPDFVKAVERLALL